MGSYLLMAKMRGEFAGFMKNNFTPRFFYLSEVKGNRRFGLGE